MALETDALEYRRRHHGLIGVESKVPVKDRATLSLVYTPGVAEPCMEIFRNPKNSFEYTCRGNTVGGGSNVCCGEFFGGPAPCTTSADCCGNMLCTAGHCACRDAGQGCASSFDCCGSLSCTSGTCQ